MSGTIYVVRRSIGEYSDRSEHSVCWFEGEEDAKQFVLEADRIERELGEQESARQKAWARSHGPWPRYNDPARDQYYREWAEFCSQRPKHPLCGHTVEGNEYGEVSSYWYEAVARGTAP